MDIDCASHKWFTQAYHYKHKRMHGLDVSVDSILVAPPLSKLKGDREPQRNSWFCALTVVIFDLKE